MVSAINVSEPLFSRTSIMGAKSHIICAEVTIIRWQSHFYCIRSAILVDKYYFINCSIFGDKFNFIFIVCIVVISWLISAVLSWSIPQTLDCLDFANTAPLYSRKVSLFSCQYFHYKVNNSAILALHWNIFQYKINISIIMSFYYKIYPTLS